MDEYLILEFETKETGEACLGSLNQVAAHYFASLGYTIKQGVEGIAVVGKNSRTREDNPNGLTTSWDELKESPDATFYFSSPTSDPRFKDWRDYMPEGIYLGEEKSFPQSWIRTEDN